MCGIFGIVSNENVAPKIILGIYDLQHRGEQGTGIAVSDGKQLKEYKRAGLVTEVFSEKRRERIFKRCAGNFGIGHTLYSTIGKTGEEKQPQTYQPLVGNFHGKRFAVAHNGNLVKFEGLRKEAEEKGYKFQSETSDTEVIVALLSTSPEKDFLEALKKVLPRLKGAFALAILFKDKVIGVRDRYGIRPLCLGQEPTSFILASESCAFYTLGANFIREIEPGEIIVLGKNGIEDHFVWAKNPQLKLCIFEFIYFARPDSRLAGRSVYSYRKNAGETLAKEQPVEADIVMPVPESGRIYDYAYAWPLKIPIEEGLFKNRYFTIKTFLTTRETDRRSLQRIKSHPLREVVHEKRVCITEDSIIRANVLPEVVLMLREAGAREVHARVFSAPIRFPCFLGIDMATRVELAAASLAVEELGKKVIHSDSLGYLSLDGMIKASGLPKEKLCLGCFTGEYPVEPPHNFNPKPPS
jgi:amidophosphoribosyltransferase